MIDRYRLRLLHADPTIEADLHEGRVQEMIRICINKRAIYGATM